MEPDIARIRAIEVYTSELYARALLRVRPSVVDLVKSEVEFGSLPKPVEISPEEREKVPFLFGSEIHVRRLDNSSFMFCSIQATVLVLKHTIEHQQYLYALQVQFVKIIIDTLFFLYLSTPVFRQNGMHGRRLYSSANFWLSLSMKLLWWMTRHFLVSCLAPDLVKEEVREKPVANSKRPAVPAPVPPLLWTCENFDRLFLFRYRVI